MESVAKLTISEFNETLNQDFVLKGVEHLLNVRYNGWKGTRFEGLKLLWVGLSEIRDGVAILIFETGLQKNVPNRVIGCNPEEITKMFYS